jgi:hypothetical protein
MARATKPKSVGSITVDREGATYLVRVEDETGKAVTYQATSDQVFRLADALDDLLAAEEEEQTARVAPSKHTGADLDQMGIVKWYSGTKGFGFVTAASGEDAFSAPVCRAAGGL